MQNVKVRAKVKISFINFQTPFNLNQLFVFQSKDIKVYKIIQCDSNAYYPVTVSDVHFEIKNGYVYVNGNLTSDYTISSPVKVIICFSLLLLTFLLISSFLQATLEVKYYVEAFHIWTIIPCIDKIGSCPFTDLCSFGLPTNQTCPERFQKDKVPCRCPIPKVS